MAHDRLVTQFNFEKTKTSANQLWRNRQPGQGSTENLVVTKEPDISRLRAIYKRNASQTRPRPIASGYPQAANG